MDYGAFSLAFNIFLVISSLHSALIIEPMSVLGPARHSEDLAGYLRRVISVHFGIFLALALVSLSISVFVPNPALAMSMLAMSVSSPLILLFWMTRRAHYLETRPDLAVLASSIHLGALCLFAIPLWKFHLLNAVTGFAALAIAGLISALFSIERMGIGVLPLVRAIRHAVPVAREHWDFGRWLLPSALFFPLLAQVQLFLTAALLGLESAGVFRALQNPILPVIQVITALATLAMPILARDYGAGREDLVYRRGVQYAVLMTAIALAFELAILSTGNLWDRVLYKGKYSRYDSLMLVLGIVPIVTAIATGCSVVLRAIQRPKLTTITHIAGGSFGLIASYLLIRFWRLPGAAYGLVASYSMTALVSVYLTIRAKAAMPVTA